MAKESREPVTEQLIASASSYLRGVAEVHSRMLIAIQQVNADGSAFETLNLNQPIQPDAARDWILLRDLVLAETHVSGTAPTATLDVAAPSFSDALLISFQSVAGMVLSRTAEMSSLRLALLAIRSEMDVAAEIRRLTRNLAGCEREFALVLSKIRAGRELTVRRIVNSPRLAPTDVCLWVLESGGVQVIHGEKPRRFSEGHLRQLGMSPNSLRLLRELAINDGCLLDPTAREQLEAKDDLEEARKSRRQPESSAERRAFLEQRDRIREARRTAIGKLNGELVALLGLGSKPILLRRKPRRIESQFREIRWVDPIAEEDANP